MIALILAYISRYKTILISLGALIAFSGGFYLRGLLYDAGELKQAKLDLQKHIELETIYRQASTNYQKLNQSLLSSNTDLMDKANALPETNCDKSELPADRLQLLRKARSVATR